MISDVQEVEEEHHEESVVHQPDETPAEISFHATSGPVEIDFEKLTLGFRLAGSSHKLQGLKGSELAALKSHECIGLNCTAMLLQISPITDNPLPNHTPCPTIQSVLLEFANIFQEPNGLPQGVSKTTTFHCYWVLDPFVLDHIDNLIIKKPRLKSKCESYFSKA
ncbi:hypothetical protein Tco_0141515 [Tanacetum coccineum]